MVAYLPEGWKIEDLGKHLNEVNTRNKPKANMPVLSVTNSQGFVSSEDYFDRQVFSKDLSNYKIVSEGQFAYNPSRLNVGSLARLKDWPAGLLSPMYVVFESQETLLPSFLSYWLKSQWARNQIHNSTQGTVRDSVNFSALANFKIKIPTLPEQHEIANILGVVDEAIIATRRVIDQTQNLRLSLLDQFFVATDLSGEVLDDLPEGFSVHLLDDIASRGSGHTPDRKMASYWNGGIKWVSLADSNRLDQVYISQTEHEISENGIKHSSAVHHTRNTVIVSRDAGVGKSAILAEEGMAVSQHFIAWKCGERLKPLYLYYWLQNMKPVFERLAAGNAIKTIGLSFFKKVRIALPNTRLQEKHSSLLHQTDIRLADEAKKLRQLEALKSSLLSGLLSGAIRVKD